MLGIITLILLVVPAIAILCRLWVSAGGSFPKIWKVADGAGNRNPVYSGILPEEYSHEVISGKQLALLFFGAVSFRLLVYILSYGILWKQMAVKLPLDVSWQDFLDNWLRWDARHYVDIAQFSYSGVLENGEPLMLVFFPLYPFLVRLFYLIIGNYTLAGMLLSTLSYAGGLCYLYLLAARECGKKTANISVVLISIFPFSFFFGGVMTESLFLLVSTAALYYIRTRRYLAASLFGMAAGMTRMHGILLVSVMLAEMAEDNRVLSSEYINGEGSKSFGLLSVKAAGFAGIMCLGPSLYLFLNYLVTGNPLQFQIYQKEHWFQEPGLVTETLHYLFENMISYSGISDRIFLWMPEFILFFFCTFFLWCGIKDLGTPLMLYFLLYFLLNYSVTWLLSAGRYMSCAVPMFLVMGMVLKKNWRIRYAVYFLFCMGFVIFLNAFFDGKSVM